MKQKFIFLVLIACYLHSGAQPLRLFELDANIPEKKIYSDHLKLGGTNPKGERIAVNNYYMTVNNKPFIPVTGEFHFSRYPRQYWEESIRKMKAGGINVIATYVFWNLHEEKEGEFDWKGDRDLRLFIDLCRKNNIYALVRIGPFCHGEIRNGGLPDWLLGKPLTIRSNDRFYLQHVERLYHEIGKQLNGLYYKDGGPVIGIQIENEYQHSAAPWGLTYPGQPNDMTAAERDLSVTQEGVGIATERNPYAELGNDHMKVLKALSVKAGMDVPLYTATGWGNAAIIPNESIPVTAAYAYPFWTPKRDQSPFFLYKDMHRNPDYAPVRYKPEDYPAFPAELGAGIMTIYSRRPIAVHKSFDAMINRCLGSGANGIGYYMYHGGSTPRGERSFMSDEAYGLPKISYDFQASIGEFGQVREGFHRLKLLHFFVQDFGDLLAPMTTVLPENAAGLKSTNISDLRYAMRVKGNSGFLFLNNFQDDTTMLDQNNIQVKIKTSSGEMTIPEANGFDLKSGENVIFPFNLDLDGIKLNYATAQLMMKGDDKSEPYYVFFSPQGVRAEFSFPAGTTVKGVLGIATEQNSRRVLVKSKAELSEFTISQNGISRRILVLSKDMALKSNRVMIGGKKHLIISDAVVLEDGNGFQFLSDEKSEFGMGIYPKISLLPKAATGKVTKGKGPASLSSYRVSLPAVSLVASTRQISPKKLTVELPATLPPHVNDIYLTVDYTGDTGMGFLNGELVTDEFYKGIPWQIGLRKFISPSAKEMVLYFRPIQKNSTYLRDLQPYPHSIPDFGNGKNYLKVNKISMAAQYKTTIQFY